MASIAGTLARIQEDLQPFIPEASVHAACRQAGHRWRERKLGPMQTLHLFILQVLCFNTAMTHLRHLSKTAVNASAYCKARMRLPLKVLEGLLQESAAAMQRGCDSPGAVWCGLRTYLVDGSSTIVPDTPESQKAFGQPKGCKEGCGFPVPKILGLFDAFTGLMLQTLCFPLYTHEQSKVWMLHPLLKTGELLVGDRGFCSFVHLAMLFSRGVQGLFRIHQKQIVDFRPHRKYRAQRQKTRKAKGRRKGSASRPGRAKTAPPIPRTKFIKRLGKHDQVVQWFKPAASRPKWITDEQWDALPESLMLRELRFSLPRKGQRTLVVTVVTTLLDPDLYPKEKIAELYGVRWRVETHFAELKTTLGMRKLKSRTPEGVKKELTVYALVYNLVHHVMCKAAGAQQVSPDRISFIDALRWILSADPGEPTPPLIVNPRRPGRHEPRVVKDREDTYTKMTRPRNILRKELKKQAVEA